MTVLLAILALIPSPTVLHAPDQFKPRPLKMRAWVPCERVLACHMRQVVRPYRARLMRMAWCESTGRWHIATGNGFYGGLQFTLSSWQAVGGRGYPHHASRLEQMYRAVLLSRLQGWGAWPVCQYA